MKKIIFAAFIIGLAVIFLEPESVSGGRGGRGGGGRGGGGGARVSGGGARVGGGGGVVNSYGGGNFGGGNVGGRASTSIVGPGGGSGHAGRGSGSITTKGGSTIDYKGAGIGGSTAGGAAGGKYVGGIQVTTPGGRELSKVGSGGAIQGPGGNVVGGKSGVTVGSGPQGSVGGKYQSGAVLGPQGGIAGKSQVGVGVGAGGAVVGGSRAGVASGPYAAVAGRNTVVAGRGTHYHSATAIRSQAVHVRHGCAHYPCFRPGWYTRHPGAWFAAGWAASSVWRACTWATCASYCGYPVEPIYYVYGENVVYQDDGVYYGADRVYSAEEYAQRATTLADTGRDAKVSKDEEWLPLGVFALIYGEQTTSNHIFQLAVNKQGVIRGNYYDAVTDTTDPVYGSVDKNTQRAAWTVGDRKTPVYEAGIANLTQDETTMLVHYGGDRSEQFSLVRIEEPEMTEGK